MEIDTTVTIDPCDVLDEMSTSEIRDYLEGRMDYELEELPDTVSMVNAKDMIIAICSIKRNELLIDKQTAKSVMNELIDDLC